MALTLINTRTVIKMSIENIYMMGAGAIGSNLLLQLIKVKPELTFNAIDFDVVEDRNLRTQAFFREHRNVPKVLALQSILSRYVEKPKYKGHKARLDSRNFNDIPENSLVIDCFDNVDSTELLMAKGYKHLLHASFSIYELGNAELSWTENFKPMKESSEVEGIDVCALNSAGPFIHFFVNLIAMEVVNFLDNGEKNDYLITGMHRVKKL